GRRCCPRGAEAVVPGFAPSRAAGDPRRRGACCAVDRADRCRMRRGNAESRRRSTLQEMKTRPTADQIQRAPKALLHDHLDGGVRPRTVVELAEQTGYQGLPTTDHSEIAQWFAEATTAGSLEEYLERFTHTVGVLQT